MELTGKMRHIGEEKSFPSGFTKREFVITTEEQYPQEIPFELFKEKGNLIDAFKVGDRVVVSFDIRGREWQGKWFVNLAAWKVVPAGAGVAAAPVPPPPGPGDYNEPEDDDLPF
ncbi:MAG: hypothetical protein RL220_1666 [Bacteroidota bacterium]|jgi:hypothetical protein